MKFSIYSCHCASVLYFETEKKKHGFQKQPLLRCLCISEDSGVPHICVPLRYLIDSDNENDLPCASFIKNEVFLLQIMKENYTLYSSPSFFSLTKK